MSRSPAMGECGPDKVVLRNMSRLNAALLVVKCGLRSPQRSFKESVGDTIRLGTHPTRLAALISIKQQLYKKWLILIAAEHSGAGGGVTVKEVKINVLKLIMAE